MQRVMAFLRSLLVLDLPSALPRNKIEFVKFSLLQIEIKFRSSINDVTQRGRVSLFVGKIQKKWQMGRGVKQMPKFVGRHL